MSRNKLVVLLVDDSRAMRRIQREVLSALGDLEIIEAEDGVSAIQQLKAQDFQVDLILTDWVMPRMNGMSLVKLLKSNEHLSKIPVLMVTSCCDEHKMREAWTSGVDGYLLKPFTRELFLQALLSLECDRSVAIDRSAEDQRSGPGESRAFLEVLPLEMRRRILDMSIIVEHQDGHSILRKGDVAPYFFYVIDGDVEEKQSVAGGQNAVVRRYQTGECFAVTELMSGDSINSDFLAASDDCRIGRVAHAAFEGMLLKYPEIGISLSKVLASKARQIETEDDNTANLSGALEVLDLPALIQAISLRQKTCVIELPETGSEIYVVCGQVVAASHGELEGKEALFQMLRDDPGNFRLAVKSVHCKRNIQDSTMNLLLECARQMDEAAAV